MRLDLSKLCGSRTLREASYIRLGLTKSPGATDAERRGLRTKTALIHELRRAGVKRAEWLVGNIRPSERHQVGRYGRWVNYYNPWYLQSFVRDALLAWRKTGRRGSTATADEIFLPLCIDHETTNRLKEHFADRIQEYIPDIASSQSENRYFAGDAWLGTAEDMLLYVLLRHRPGVEAVWPHMPRGMRMKTAINRYLSGRGGPVRTMLHEKLASIGITPKDRAATGPATTCDKELLAWARRKHAKVVFAKDEHSLSRFWNDRGWVAIVRIGDYKVLAKVLK